MLRFQNWVAGTYLLGHFCYYNFGSAELGPIRISTEPYICTWQRTLTERLTSCLSCLDSAALFMLN